MSHPVLALFLHCCWMRGYDAQAMLRAAFPSLSENLRETAAEIAAQADWEGTLFPDDWSNPPLVGRLLVALDQAGYHTLADALQAVLLNGS